MQDFDKGTFGELYADTYDADRPHMAAETEASVALLAELAHGPDILELAVGTGRVALPLAARGFRVTGIEASPEMVAQLRNKPGAEAIQTVMGDMADVAVPGPFHLGFLVYNTLFNLTSQDAQVRCFHNVARVLRPGGCFVVETFVPDLSGFSGHQSVRALEVERGHVKLDVQQHDPVMQTISYQRVRIEAGGTTMAPLVLRYAWPSELDLMARLAGLDLTHRWSGWDRAPFTADSTRHVSVYTRPTP